MWVADDTDDDKLFAYNLSTKARDSSDNDFDHTDVAARNQFSDSASGPTATPCGLG